MRIWTLAFLLAGAAAPSIAAAPDDDRRQRRDDSRAERSERAERAERGETGRGNEQGSSERSAPAQTRRAVESQAGDSSPGASGDRPAVSSDSRPRGLGGRQASSSDDDGGRGSGRGLGNSSSARADAPARVDAPAMEGAGEPTPRRAAGDTVRHWRMRDRQNDDRPTSIEERNLRRAPAIREADSGLGEPGIRVVTDGGLVQPSRSRPLPRVFDPQRRRVSETPELGTEPPKPATAAAAQATPRHRWRNDWRRDHKYNWRDWRRRHRSLFHLGFYYDPFGWRYHRYGIGWRLWPSYYRSSFWLSDPWRYRLPPAYGPYRWIRYHHDALLVNIYTGEVVDVVYDFFW